MVTVVSEDSPRIVVGVDSHKDTHQAAVLDARGALLGNRNFVASLRGYRELEEWLASLGEVDRVGIECTGSYAAGLTRYLRERDINVLEVNATHRATTSRRGKDDAIDAEMVTRIMESPQSRSSKFPTP